MEDRAHPLAIIALKRREGEVRAQVNDAQKTPKGTSHTRRLAASVKTATMVVKTKCDSYVAALSGFSTL